MIEYMLVMEVTPIDERKFKHRVFIKHTRGVGVTSQQILDAEVAEAKRLRIKVSEVLTVHIVKLQ